MTSQELLFRKLVWALLQDASGVGADATEPRRKDMGTVRQLLEESKRMLFELEGSDASSS